jgi:hypothetical protein
MRQFKRFWPRALPFRLLLVVAGALLLLAAFAPSANASLIDYFNFEDTFPDLTSDAPPGFVSNTMTTNFIAGDFLNVAGLGLNVAPGDGDGNAQALGMSRNSANQGAHFDIPLITSQGFFQNMTLTFAFARPGNGFSLVTLSFSTDGGLTFPGAGPSAILTQGAGPFLATLAVPAAANNVPLLVLRLVFTGATSNGENAELTIDNLQINGTIVPEPATVAGGLFGVLGLCWFQRRRLRLLLPRSRRA